MRHEGANFDGAFRVETSVAPVSKAEADPLIRKHYLKKWPGVVTLRMGLFYKGELLGVIVYALPPRETSKRYGGETWELARLWIDDKMPRNTETFLIGRSIRYIFRNHKNVKALVSYADPSQQHIGRIYKASNWTIDGRTDEGRKTPRCDYVGDDGKKYSRRAHIPDGMNYTRVHRVSKFRFLYRLRK